MIIYVYLKTDPPISKLEVHLFFVKKYFFCQQVRRMKVSKKRSSPLLKVEDEVFFAQIIDVQYL